MSEIPAVIMARPNNKTGHHNFQSDKYLHSRKNSSALSTTAALNAGKVGKKNEMLVTQSGGKIMHSDQKLCKYSRQAKMTITDHGPTLE
mmetsp:Transcript_26619/g.67349  ORF Transcript_26619/g.67349 Transcript_26619/m.67349 type:complete len:89 (-) Transcript_26619:744-1010(-)